MGPPQEGVEIAGGGPVIRLVGQEAGRRRFGALEPPSGGVGEGPAGVVPISRRPRPLRVAVGPFLPVAARAGPPSAKGLPLAVGEGPELGQRAPPRIGAVAEAEGVGGRLVGTGPRAPGQPRVAVPRLAPLVWLPVVAALPGEEVGGTVSQRALLLLRGAERAGGRAVHGHGAQVEGQGRVLAAAQAVPSVLPVHAARVLAVPLQVPGDVDTGPRCRAGFVVRPPEGGAGRRY